MNLVVNYGKMLSRQFQHVETEVLQMSESCHQSEAILKLVFESAYLAEDLKNILCKIAKRTAADFVETDSAADLKQLKALCKDLVKIKVSGESTLEKFQEAYNAGSERYGATDPFAIANEWKQILAAREAAAKQAAAVTG